MHGNTVRFETRFKPNKLTLKLKKLVCGQSIESAIFLYFDQ